MRALVQRVREASVAVDGRVVGAVGRGLLVLAGIATDDGDEDRDWLVRKIVGLRIFDDDEGVMNRAVAEVGGGLLAVSQFTLFASTRKGNRPSWSAAAPPEVAAARFERFVAALAVAHGGPVATGVFGASMQVALVNDGPVTIWLDSRMRE
jgi:D-tyrosyl-tRNA(Tyr) deacylase